MSLASLLTDTVTITPRSQGVVEDEYGDPQQVAGTPFTSPARVEVGYSTELLQGRDEVRIDARAFLPPATSIGRLDGLTHDGVTYEVFGLPAPQDAPSGTHHIQVELHRIEGG